MNFFKLSIFITFTFILSACGGSSKKASEVEQPLQPQIPSVNISGTSEVAEGTRVTISAATDATGSVRFEWGIFSNYDITPEVTGNTITFIAPKLYQLDSDVIEVTVDVSANGLSSGTYAFNVFVKNQNTFEDKAFIVTAGSLGAAESYDALAYIARNGINQFIQPSNDTERFCGYTGSADLNHSDNDQNGILSVGDTIHLEYTECAIRTFNIKLFGSVEITISELSIADKIVAGTMLLDNLLIEQGFIDNITAAGQLNFNFSQTNTTRSINVSHSDAVVFTLNDQPFVNLDNMSFTKTENLLDAKYSISIQGEMSDAASQESYAIRTLVPISGFFGEYALAGEIELQGENDETVLISKQDVSGSRSVNLVLEGASFQYDWNDFVESSLFYVSTAPGFGPREYFSTNFEAIGLSDLFLQLEKLAVKEFKYLTSRPISRINEGPFFFRANSYPYEEREARVEINGAQLIITIDEPQTLRAASNFALHGIDLFSELNQRLDVDFIEFTTSDSVIPIIKTSVLGYREGDLPILDASQSILNSGDTISYEWIDESSIGIVFSAPNSSVTEFSLPDTNGLPLSDIEVRLRATNNLGESAITQEILSYLPAPSSYFSMDSEVGDYIGQGQQWLLNEPGAITIKESQYQQGATSIAYEDEETRFELIIKAPNDDTLAIGEYENATRLPFQDPAVPGMDFSGEARGCNELTGSFNILELSYDAQGNIDNLSIDFTQFCEIPNGPKLTGQIRINSSLPINR